MAAVAIWNGRPPSPGWHWLRRQKDGEFRVACYSHGWWRVSDSIGRTRLMSEPGVAKLYDYVEAAPSPSSGRKAQA